MGTLTLSDLAPHNHWQLQHRYLIRGAATHPPCHHLPQVTSQRPVIKLKPVAEDQMPQLTLSP